VIAVTAGAIIAGCGSQSPQRADHAPVASKATAAASRPHCPRHVIWTAAPMSRVLRRAEALIPHAYADEYRPEEMRGWTIDDAMWLAETDLNHGYVQRFRRAASKTCGHRVAEASWAISVVFPSVHMPASQHIGFIVRTKEGWRFYKPGWAVEYASCPTH
jgi:hypothetical protein